MAKVEDSNCLVFQGPVGGGNTEHPKTGSSCQGWLQRQG
ncbi:hypothetical protein LEMLEM_LOCUS19901 [Lemmus lemmus]